MKRLSPSLARVTVALLVLLLAPSRAARADAQDEAIEKITQLNKDAITAYQQKKFEDARKVLKQALDMAASAGLETHPIAARTHIHLGIVIIVGFQQKDLGIKQFRKAIEIQGDINLTKALATPELNDAFADAKKGASAGPASPPPAAPPAKTGDGEGGEAGLTHEAVTESKQGASISITVKVPTELQFDKLVLAYRPDGATEFLGREMKQESEGTFEAEIPDTATGGSVVAYYIEAQDAEGGLVATRGTVENPMVVHLAGVGARRHDVDDGGDDDDDEDEPEARFFVGLLAGTGVGWATGDGDTNANISISPAGIAMASVGHVSPEVGYWLSNSLMLSAQLRYQYITGTTDVYANNRVYHTANYAFAAFVKATWRFGEDKFHPFFSLALGGGRIRHVVSFRSVLAPTCGPNHDTECIDTIGAGPVLLGPGGGFTYDLTDTLALVVQANSVVGFPTFTVNLDGNVGVAFAF
jgi:hypothetical protein